MEGRAKFRVSDPDQSARLQRKLFEMGYKWGGIGQTVELTDEPYLYINSGRIKYDDLLEHFEDKDSPELDPERFIRGEYEWDGNQWLLLCRPIDDTPTDNAKKTAREWFNELPEPWRTKAMGYARDLDDKHDCLEDCIVKQFRYSIMTERIDDWLRIAREKTPPSHYSMKITPLEYIEANGLDFIEGNIVKYVSRYKMKGGKEDLIKARTYLDKLIERYD